MECSIRKKLPKILRAAFLRPLKNSSMTRRAILKWISILMPWIGENPPRWSWWMKCFTSGRKRDTKCWYTRRPSPCLPSSWNTSKSSTFRTVWWTAARLSWNVKPSSISLIPIRRSFCFYSRPVWEDSESISWEPIESFSLILIGIPRLISRLANVAGGSASSVRSPSTA